MDREQQSLTENITESTELRGAVGALIERRLAAVWVVGEGRCVTVPTGQPAWERNPDPERHPPGPSRSTYGIRIPQGVLSGSFNPLHDGHQALCEAAGQRLGGPVAYELSVVNADKPPLSLADVLRRCGEFAEGGLVLTRCPTFVEKAALLPGVTFVVGIDTAARIVNGRFYGGSTREMNRALGTIREAGCRFLVAGRWLAGRFQSLSDVGVPARHLQLFEELTADEFRYDISSTELRGE